MQKLANQNNLTLAEINSLTADHIAQLKAYADVKVAQIGADTGLDIAQLQADSGLSIAELSAKTAVEVATIRGDIDKYVADLEADTGIDIAQLQSDTGISIAELTTKSAEDVAAIRASTDKYIADVQAETGIDLRELADKNNITLAELSKQAGIDIATIRAGGQVDVATINAEANKYIADLQATTQQTIAEGQMEKMFPGSVDLAKSLGINLNQALEGLTPEQEELYRSQGKTGIVRGALSAAEGTKKAFAGQGLKGGAVASALQDIEEGKVGQFAGLETSIMQADIAAKDKGIQDILAFLQLRTPGGGEMGDPDEPVVDEPVVDEPVVDEPVVDEPVVDEPVVDEPVVDEPVVDEPPAASVGATGEFWQQMGFASEEAYNAAIAGQEPVIPGGAATTTDTGLPNYGDPFQYEKDQAAKGDEDFSPTGALTNQEIFDTMSFSDAMGTFGVDVATNIWQQFDPSYFDPVTPDPYVPPAKTYDRFGNEIIDGVGTEAPNLGGYSTEAPTQAGGDDPGNLFVDQQAGTGGTQTGDPGNLFVDQQAGTGGTQTGDPGSLFLDQAQGADNNPYPDQLDLGNLTNPVDTTSQDLLTLLNSNSQYANMDELKDLLATTPDNLTIDFGQDLQDLISKDLDFSDMFTSGDADFQAMIKDELDALKKALADMQKANKYTNYGDEGGIGNTGSDVGYDFGDSLGPGTF